MCICEWVGVCVFQSLGANNCALHLLICSQASIVDDYAYYYGNYDPDYDDDDENNDNDDDGENNCAYTSLYALMQALWM